MPNKDDKQIHIKLDEQLHSKLKQTSQKNGLSIQDFVKKTLNDELTYQMKLPLEESKFTFIDLFAGIGGMRLAFEAAGGKCLFSSEIDKFCKKTYFENFGEIPEGDITQIPVDDIPDHDMLVGGFPCQPFSIAGVSKKRSLGKEDGFLDQTQGTLFFDIARIIKHKRPKAFLLENVKNLRSHDKGKTFRVICDTLQEMGYSVSSRIMDGQHFVPQHRERIFIAGVHESLNVNNPLDELELPEPSAKVKDILEKNVNPKYTLSDKLWDYLQAYSAKHKAKGNGFGFGKVDLNGVTRTLSARYHKDGSEILIPQRNKNPRRLTPRECARLQGFPDTFSIPVSDTQAYRQFGNSVTVPLVSAVAQEFITKLEQVEQDNSSVHLQHG
ncbi:DNA (cytosine-5)-methyltransferase 1 [Marinococcus luteus]|uniref:Cytosine-specific methyltransferase n=1 Tax=Marinococcus luteus TaxID=1122204 RepID=A0A1H2QG77_9BACI|nr:DNA (cytosine-5-)-methyltransferase [Marinococcus luteus]SDW06156.1 DNA (cytosine-5)-methyltransferase 1 [Marinococcus luteus]